MLTAAYAEFQHLSILYLRCPVPSAATCHRHVVSFQFSIRDASRGVSTDTVRKYLTLSILYSRCRLQKAKQSPGTGQLSILYSRCIFACPAYRGQSEMVLSILYSRCPVPRVYYIYAQHVGSFNSLFEMRDKRNKRLYPHGVLFQFSIRDAPQEVACYKLPYFTKLSILYSRCTSTMATRCLLANMS